MISLLFFLLTIISTINASQDYVVIRKSEMSDAMANHAIVESLLQFENESDLNKVAKKIVNEMNLKYGKQWECFIGLNIDKSGVNFEAQKNTYIWFMFKETHIVLFKTNVDVLLYSIFSARKVDSKISLLRNHMTDEMQKNVTAIAKNSVNNFDSFDSISNNVLKQLNSQYGTEWQCIVGIFGQITDTQTYEMNAKSGTLIIFNIESIRFIIFQEKPLGKCVAQWLMLTGIYVKMPAHAMIGGYHVDQEPLYVCRARFNSPDLMPGKANEKLGCHSTYHHLEYTEYRDYEVLIENNFNWISRNNTDPIPNNAVIGGNASDGENIYIGRCLKHDTKGDTLVIGKIHHIFYYPLNIWENNDCVDHEILVCN